MWIARTDQKALVKTDHTWPKGDWEITQCDLKDRGSCNCYAWGQISKLFCCCWLQLCSLTRINEMSVVRIFSNKPLLSNFHWFYVFTECIFHTQAQSRACCTNVLCDQGYASARRHREGFRDSQGQVGRFGHPTSSCDGSIARKWQIHFQSGARSIECRMIHVVCSENCRTDPLRLLTVGSRK